MFDLTLWRRNKITHTEDKDKEDQIEQMVVPPR